MDETRPTPEFAGGTLDRIWSGVARRHDQKLGELAVARGLLSTETLERILRDLPPDASLGAHLVLEKLITSAQLAELKGGGNEPPEVAAALQDPKRRVDHYVLVEEIGRGGMGVVWKAWDRKLHRWVAFKTLRVEGTARVHGRFQREAQAMARLRHSNIAAVHDVGGTEEAPYLVMELVEGKALDVKAPIRGVVAILRKAALGLQEAHRAGVIHRDLKPGNILVDEKSEPRVVDFGLAQLVDSDLRFTRTGAVIGTPLYMAPEQITGDTKAQGPRTDVFALGAILYEAMAGDPPFTGKSVAEIQNRILNSDATTPKGPADLATICMKAIEKDPGARYVSANDFAEDLGRFLAGEPIWARPPGRIAVARKWLRRWRVVAIATASALVAAALLLGGLEISKQRRFERLRNEAVLAWKGSNWPGGLSKAESALEIHDDPTLLRIANECRVALDREKRSRQLDEKVRPHLDSIKELRSKFYNKLTNIDAVLREGADRIAVLEELMADPKFADLPQGWAAIGIAKSLMGDIDGAEPALLKARDLGTTDGWVWFCLGRLLHDQMIELSIYPRPSAVKMEEDLQQQATDYLKKSAAAWSGAREVDLLVARAFLAFVNKDYDEVRKIFAESRARFEDQEGIEELWMLAAHCNSNDPSKILEAYSKALEIRPHYPWAYYSRGERYANRFNKPELAEEDFTSALRCNPHYAAAYRARGVLRRQRGNFSGAIDDATEALRLKPAYFGALSDRALAKSSLNDFKGAIEDFNQALGLETASVDVFIGRGVARAKSGMIDEAVADFSRAIELDPVCMNARVNRATLQAQQAKWREVVDDLTVVLRRTPDDLVTRSNRAVARFNLPDQEGAVEDCRLFLQRAPADHPLRPKMQDMLDELTK